MKIACPNCATTYEVAAAAIGAAGRSVRCVRCRSVWFAEPDATPEPAPASAVAPAPVAGPAAPPPSAAAPPAAGGLDDLAAWGLTDPAADEAQSGAAAADPPAGAADLAGGGLSMDPMLDEMQAAVPVSDGPPLVPVDDWQGATGELPSAPADAGPRPRRPRPAAALRPRGLRMPSMPTVILVLMAIITGILGWRADVVRVMPQTASLFAAIGLPVNLRGLAFEDVKASKEVQDGVSVLVLEGRIVNISRLMLEVPRIRFALRNTAGHEIYNWTALPTRPVLPPNAEQTFRSRLAAPPADGRDITVRFFTRRDALGGFR